MSLNCVPCLEKFNERYGTQIPSCGMERAGAAHADTVWKGTALCLRHYYEARGIKEVKQ